MSNVLAWAAGPVWLAILWFIGAWLLARLNMPSIGMLPDNIRLVLGSAAGLVVVCLAFGILLLLRAIWLSPFIIAAALVLAALDWRAFRSHYRGIEWPASAMWIFLGTAAFSSLLLVAADLGSAKGANIFWTIYNLTFITPGDSPQGLMQAQYLVYGPQRLANFDNFSIFDRTILGGILTAGALCAFANCVGSTFVEWTTSQMLMYTSIWIWLNALVVFAVWEIVGLFTRHRQAAVTILICAVPTITLNIVGLWPKSVANFFLVLALLCALQRRFLLATLWSSAAFQLHGSFLWPHLALAVASASFIALYDRRPAYGLPIMITAAAVPALWFGADRFSGEIVPLRAYYLYDAGIAEALHGSLRDIVDRFYASTNAVNLAALPVVNFVKFLLPLESLQSLVQFTYKGAPVDWSAALGAYYWTQLNHPIFFGGFFLAVLVIAGLLFSWAKDWRVPAGALLLVILPLVATAGLYRRDQMFYTIIFPYAVLPAIAAAAYGARNFGRKPVLALAGLALVEFLLTYWSRASGVSYWGAVVVALATVAAAIYSMTLADRQCGATTDEASWCDIGLTRHLTWWIVLCVALMPLMPLLTLIVLGDGGVRLLWR